MCRASLTLLLGRRWSPSSFAPSQHSHPVVPSLCPTYRAHTHCVAPACPLHCVQVDLYENGTIAIVEAVSPELGNRVQRVRVQLPGTSSGEQTPGRCVTCCLVLGQALGQHLCQQRVAQRSSLEGCAHCTLVAATAVLARISTSLSAQAD
jgi:hypothetical protein